MLPCLNLVIHLFSQSRLILVDVSNTVIKNDKIQNFRQTGLANLGPVNMITQSAILQRNIK